MGVLPQHVQENPKTGLKAFAHAVQLIAPQGCGIDQRQGSQRKGRRHQSCPKGPELSRSFHRP